MELLIKGEKRSFQDGVNALDILRDFEGDIKKNAIGVKGQFDVAFDAASPRTVGINR